MSTYTKKPQTARTRIVCISDTHNQTSQLPKGDVLIHAGDLTNQGSYTELKKTISWLEKADFEVKIVIAGNHDITLDSDFYSEHWPYFHNQHKQDSEDCISLLRDSPSITYLEHQAYHIKLTSPLGPQTHFKVFGSPYSPAHGLWAFGYKDEDAARLWQDIPLDTDILITHTPPKGHCDWMVTKNRAGCGHLQRRLWTVRPKVHVCGHLHEGRGAESIRWKDDVPGCPYMEESVEHWCDPGAGEGNKKQSLLDLTEKMRSEWASAPTVLLNTPSTSQQRRKPEGQAYFLGSETESPMVEQLRRLKDVDSQWKSLAEHTIPHDKKVATIRDLAARSAADDGSADCGTIVPTEDIEPSIKGRSSTCVVNAAIMKNSWGGPKRLNKPIVVDIDLPVWREYL